MKYSEMVIGADSNIEKCINGLDIVRLYCADCGNAWNAKLHCDKRYICPSCSKVYEREESRIISNMFHNVIDSVSNKLIIDYPISLYHMVITFPEAAEKQIILKGQDALSINKVLKNVVNYFIFKQFGMVAGVNAIHLNGDEEPLKRRIHIDSTFLNIRLEKDKYFAFQPIIDINDARQFLKQIINNYFGTNAPEVVLWLDYTKIYESGRYVHKINYETHGPVSCFEKKKDWKPSDYKKVLKFISQIPKYLVRYRRFGWLSNTKRKEHCFEFFSVAETRHKLSCPCCQSRKVEFENVAYQAINDTDYKSRWISNKRFLEVWDSEVIPSLREQ